MRVVTKKRPQPPQVGGELLDRDTLLVAQFAYGPPMRDRRGAPLSPPLDAVVPPPDQQIVEEHTQNRDEHHDGDGDTTKYHLVQVHRHEITLSRALWVHKPRPDRETSCYLRGTRATANRVAAQLLRNQCLGAAAVAVDRDVYVVHVIGGR